MIGNYILLLTYYNNKVKPLLYVGGSGKRGGYYISGKNFIVKMGGSDFYYLGYFTIKQEISSNKTVTIYNGKE